MNERSFFDFDPHSDDSDHRGSIPWGGRFQNFSESTGHDPLPDRVIEGTFDEDNLPTHGEIIELIETLHAGESSPFLVRATTDRAHLVHLPEHYEAGYAYPLVVWFHGDGSSEAEVTSVMPNISERNYIGLALRGNVVSGKGYGWSTSGDGRQRLIADVESLVLAMRRQYHIHSERIYLAGFGSGATAAIELILQKPEWFGGAACFCGAFPELRVPQRGDHELRNKRVLLATSANSRICKVGDLITAGRFLYSSGMRIGTRVYQDAGTGPSSKMLSDINHWLMDDVCSTVG